MKLKRYKKKKISSYISLGIIMIVISLICSFLVINYFAKRVNKILYPMAESLTRKVVTMVINASCDNIKIDSDLYSLSNNTNGEISMVVYNSFKVTKLINEVTYNIQNMIKAIERGELNYYGEVDIAENGIIAEIPFGVVFDNPLLSNIGPRIKLRLNLLGDVASNIETEVKPYGINNAYVEMRIHLEVTARIILPFVSEKVVISNVIPLSMNIVQGSVPQAYISSFK